MAHARAPLTLAERRLRAAEAHAGWPARGGGAKKLQARARLARALWKRSGERKLPSGSELDAALSGLTPDELEWVCELSPLGPLYFLPTRRFANALARSVRELGARRVLEVAAGDGFLSRALKQADPSLDVLASDSGAWERPEARMNRAERRMLRGTPVPGIELGGEVQRMDAARAIRELKPDLVLACWLPPGALLDELVRANVRYVLEIGAGAGITASAWSWRFAHEFCEGPLERHARCRLDARPLRKLHSRITLYFGARHEEHAEDRVEKGEWLWQFRPKPRRGSR